MLSYFIPKRLPHDRFNISNLCILEKKKQNKTNKQTNKNPKNLCFWVNEGQTETSIACERPQLYSC